MMDLSYPYFSKARILQLSEDLTHARTTLIREKHPMDYTDHPVCVLLLTAMDQINPDEHGQTYHFLDRFDMDFDSRIAEPRRSHCRELGVSRAFLKVEGWVALLLHSIGGFVAGYCFRVQIRTSVPALDDLVSAPPLSKKTSPLTSFTSTSSTQDPTSTLLATSCSSSPPAHGDLAFLPLATMSTISSNGKH
ncbi:hypothetical protein F2Q69_00006715 [Brassica cretica]|uniref:Uncharacterized protein n=1 Tax=Brassica cretica TaxID=69181 RepID=A0A8S9PIM3_BRACR|nr:hypothetical protein F2Q69_00006715 [Brassica cretica]